MSKLTHRNNRAANNHSLYQTNLLTDHTQLLTDIKTNTANINLNVDTLEVNTDGLEALQTTANTTLAAILVDTDAADSSLNEIEAASVLTASRLNNIQNKISANVDGTGDTLGQITSNILSKNTDAEAHLGNIDTGIDVLEACVGSNKVNVNISSGTVTAELSATDNAVLDDIASKAGSIKTAVELLDNAISGNEIQADIVASLPAGTNKIGAVALKANEAADGSGTERHLVTDANGFLQVEDKTLTIVAPTVNLAESTSLQRVNLSLHDSGNSTTRTAKCNASGELLVNASGTVTANLSATDNAVLDDIASKAGSIKTAVELLDNAISGNEIQADIVASLPAGANKIGAVALKANEAVDGSGTERHLVTDANGFLQVEDKALTILAPTILQSESTILQRVNLSLHDSGNSTTRTAKCNASGELLVNASGTVTANLSATDNAVLDDIASKAGSIKTAVELLDNAISGNEIQADIVASLPAGSNAIGKLAANSGVDIGDVDVTSISAGTNRIGMVGLKANEAADGSGTERHLLCDTAGHLQVDVVSAPSTAVTGTVTANLSATDNAVLDDIASKAGSIKTAVEVIDDIVKTEDLAHSSGDKGVMFLGVRQSSQADFGADGDYVPISINDDGEIRVTSSGSGGATEAKQDVLETTLTAIETSVQALDNAVDGNYLNVNLNLAGSDVEGNSGNKSAATPRVVIATDDVNLSAIKTAVELIDNAISGSEIQADIVAALPAGDNNIGNVDIASALPAGSNAIGKLAANSGVDIGDVDVTSISAGTNRIGMVALKANENVGGSGTERHLLCDSAGHLQVDVVSAPSTAVTGTVTANLSATDNAVLDAIDAVLDTIKVDTEAIETAVEALQVLQGVTETLIFDSVTINASANSTSSEIVLTKTSKGGGSTFFLMEYSGSVAGSELEVAAFVAHSSGGTFYEMSASNLNINDAENSGQARFIELRNFTPKYLKLKVSNTNSSGQNTTITMKMFH